MEAIIDQLNQCITNMEDRARLANFVNDCVNGRKRYKFMIVSGSGCGGKSMFLKMLQNYLGNKSLLLSSSVLTKPLPIYGPEFTLLQNKTLVSFDDPSEYIRNLNLAFLLFTRQVTARSLYQSAKLIDNKANYLLIVSHLHIIQNLDTNFYEIVNFDKDFTK